MDDEELRELQDPATWDDQDDAILPPAQNPEVVVSVFLAQADFARVASASRDQGLRLSEFIRDALLDHAAEQHGSTRPVLIFDKRTNSTSAYTGNTTSANVEIVNASLAVSTAAVG